MIIAEPALVPVYVLKENISDGVYRIGLIPTDTPKLGVVFPSDGSGEELVAIPITLSMVWKNSTTILSTATRQ